MTTRFRRPMLWLGTTILVMQAVFMPVGMVYAETTSDTEEQEIVELPPMKNYLEEEQASDPRFFFTRSRMQGVAEEPLQVKFFSDQEVSEARVFLPEEATLQKEQLPTGFSVEEGAQSNEWLVQSKRAQNTFVLPLVFKKVGIYVVSLESETIILEISNTNQTNEGEMTESKESDISKELKTLRSSMNVSTWQQFVTAINDVNIKVINLLANITGNQNLYIRKDITINGNGFTINIQNNEIFLDSSGIQFTDMGTQCCTQELKIFQV